MNEYRKTLPISNNVQAYIKANGTLLLVADVTANTERTD